MEAVCSWGQSLGLTDIFTPNPEAGIEHPREEVPTAAVPSLHPQVQWDKA